MPVASIVLVLGGNEKPLGSQGVLLAWPTDFGCEVEYFGGGAAMSLDSGLVENIFSSDLDDLDGFQRDIVAVCGG